jgi:hypothetical protein
MNLLGRWHPRFWRRELPTVPDRGTCFEAAQASGLNDLQTRLNRWSSLWTLENESATSTQAQQLVAERLAHCMESCFGQHLHSSLLGKGIQISLASSTPIFTAFLGRRATRELARRVLQDI